MIHVYVRYGYTILLLCAGDLFHRVQPAPDCCALGFGDTTPTSGTSLSICKSESLQCCSPFVEQHIFNVEPELVKFLQVEYQNGINAFVDMTGNLTKYIIEDFIQDLLCALSLATNHPDIDSSIEKITDYIKTGRSDGCKLFPELMKVSIEVFSHNLGGENTNVIECINSTTNELIDEEALNTVSEELTKLPSVIAALGKIGSFVKSQENRTQDATVNSQCVNGFISAAHCRQCIKRIPPLCMGTCNALLRGCYSPYYTVFNGQFAELWTEVGRVVKIASSAVTNIISNAKKVVDYSALLKDIEEQCEVTDDANEETKQGRNGIPADLVVGLTDFTGPFQYGSEDLQLCRLYLQVNACTSEVNQRVQDCELQDPAQLKNDTYTCDPGKVCTSECVCFDGVVSTTDSETSQIFDGNDIHDQGDNPAFTEPLDIAKLRSKVSSLEDGANPVAEFLSTDYTSVKPKENELRAGCGGDSGGGGDVGGGSSAMAASWVTLLITTPAVPLVQTVWGIFI